jgi:tripartite ATP-independent transporter DctP family solute receptor
MTLNRRQFSAIATVGLCAAPLHSVRAQAPTITLKFGNSTPIDHPTNIRMREVAEAVRKDSGGRVDLQIYPNGQLGSEPDMVSQVSSGAIDMMSTSGAYLQTRSPSAGINGLAFAFKDYEAIWAALDGDVGNHVRAGLQKVGFFTFDKVFDMGYRHVTTSGKPINTPADLANFKIRVPPIPMYLSMFKVLGAAPTAIPVGELYSSLQTKVVDGQENALVTIETARLYEVQKCCSLTRHIWDGAFLVGNGKKFKTLPQEVQDMLAKYVNAAAIKQREDIAKINADVQARLTKAGIAFNSPDPLLFRKVLQDAGFYKEWKAKFGEELWAKLEKYTGSLT